MSKGLESTGPGGAMQDWSMRVTHVIDHAAREAGSREIVTRWADGTQTRTDWAGIRRDALKMAQALEALGLKPGDKVASLAMNHSRHLVSWYGVAGMGGVLHTVNPRLFEDQLEYIINHADDRVLLYDAAFQPIVDLMRDRWPKVEHYICFDPPAGSDVRGSEDWIGEQDGDFEWVQGSERDPCMICYTSGTTGNPKGVQYEHRSTLMHATAGLQPAAFNFSASSVMLPVVPMFHATSWGLRVQDFFRAHPFEPVVTRVEFAHVIEAHPAPAARPVEPVAVARRAEFPRFGAGRMFAHSPVRFVSPMKLCLPHSVKDGDWARSCKAHTTAMQGDRTHGGNRPAGNGASAHRSFQPDAAGSRQRQREAQRPYGR